MATSEPETQAAPDPREGASLLRRIFTSPSKSIAEPEKEIRFTRVAQATLFFFLTIIFIMLCISTLFCMYINWGPWHADFHDNWYYSLLALIPAAICFRIALHCIRHAYIILTPMGIEIFPFFKPQKNLQVIFWSDIHHADRDYYELTLHYNEEETSGIVLSLKPIGKNNYQLLEAAIQGRLK